MSEPQNPPGLSLRSVPRLPLASVALLLVSGVLGAVALGVTWSDFEGTSGGFGMGGGSYDGSYGAFAITFIGAEEPYSSADLDGADGIGLMRAGGPLLAVGMSLAFVALVLVVLDLFVPDRFLDLVAAGTAGLGFLLLLAAVIVLPLGIVRSVEGFGSGITAAWSAGLFLAIAAATASLAGAGTMLAHRLREADAGTGA